MKRLLLILLVHSVLCGISQENSITEHNMEFRFLSLFNKSSKPTVNCYRIPAIITAKNGDVIVAMDERVPSCGDLRWNNDINIVVRRSTDNGDTWSVLETVVDYPNGQSASDPSFILDKITGTIFLFYNFMDLVNHINVYRHMYIKSVDNGQTWSRPVDITMEITKPSWENNFKFITSGEGTQTKFGALLHTLVNLEEGVFVFRSDDHGNTWRVIETPVKPADESKIVELYDGTWMINSRVNGLGIRYIHLSKDQGKSWTSYQDSILTDPGCNASIIKHTLSQDGAKKNVLIFSNANSKNHRANMTIRFSFDNGSSWTPGKTIYSGNSAYSSMTILKNGDIGLFFEKDNYSDNVFVRLPKEWISKF